ncbi:MAG: hypothetical protein ACO28R_02595 [Vulcanococcus sp.]
MDEGNWEIGLSGSSIEDLLSGEQASQTLWYLAGYLKGIADCNDIHGDERRMVIEPDGDGSWRVRSSALDPRERDL